MIKETELRIGNYVFSKHKYGCNHIVLGVKNEKVELSNTAKWVDIKFIEPIELTEEILLKCGFEKTQEGCIKTLSYQSNIGLIKMKDRFMVSMSCPFGLFQSKSIKYIHQLQNLIFALTQKELEINL